MSGSTVLGFSFTGATIASGCGTLTNLSLNGDATGLSSIVVSDASGSGVDFTYFDGSGGGDDRVKEFQKLTDKYNGVHYDFKSINIKSAGARNPKSEDPLEKLSASALRKHATSGDHEAFHAGTGGYKHSKQMMADVAAGMTPPEKAAKKKKAKAKKESWLFAPKLYQQELREHYIEEDLFAVGTLVEYDDTGIRGHIVHRGSNYVILKDSYGDEFRTWLHHVTEVTDASKNREDQSNFSADDGSGNDWKVGTDKYRQAVQAMTPGQATTKFGVKFSDFRKTATPK